LSFQCKLDKKPFRACRSPKTFKHLKAGTHVFEVRAKDSRGQLDRAPAKKQFKIA